MFFRLVACVFLGWLLMAVVAGLAPVFDLTIMLPATSIVVLTYFAFARHGDLHWGLATAVALGYLEDLQQGAPVGVLCLAHSLAYLGLWWLSRRVALRGRMSVLVVVGTAAFALDTLTWAILSALAGPLGISRAGLNATWGLVGWHLLATVLVAPLVWSVIHALISRVDRVLEGAPVPREMIE
jgi:hypothetical protein